MNVHSQSRRAEKRSEELEVKMERLKPPGKVERTSAHYKEEARRALGPPASIFVVFSMKSDQGAVGPGIIGVAA